MEQRKEIIIDGAVMHIVLGKTVKEWEITYSESDDLWSIPFEEILDGALEVNENIWYWYIDGRVYETEETAF